MGSWVKYSDSTAMFFRSQATPGGKTCLSYWEGLTLVGEAVSGLEHRKNSRRIALEWKCVAGFRAGTVEKVSPGSGICPGQILWKVQLHSPHFSSTGKGSAQEACPSSLGPFPEVHWGPPFWWKRSSSGGSINLADFQGTPTMQDTMLGAWSSANKADMVLDSVGFPIKVRGLST